MKTIVVNILIFFFKSFKWFVLLSLLTVALYGVLPISNSPLAVLRCIEQATSGKPVVMKKNWVPLSQISENLQLAVVCSEDQNFLEHDGIDMDALEKAMAYNEKSKSRKKKKIRGGSTISMQTAKNAFLWPSRTYIRKGFELYFTKMMELGWSKERIMEVYLNIIEMGDGIYGAEAAAQQYFHKSAKNLSREEAAMIAAVLPNPRKYNAGAPTAYVSRRQAWILRQMAHWDYNLDYDKADEAPKK